MTTDSTDPTQRCPITGDATFTRALQLDQPDQYEWDRADPEIHISDEVLDHLSIVGRAFVETRYELGERCPYNLSWRHARLRDHAKEASDR